VNRNNLGCRVVLCLHFRTCLSGRPRIGLFTDGPSAGPEVPTLFRSRRPRQQIELNGPAGRMIAAVLLGSAEIELE
jgi:hypothetical protein